jgi:hypothetical protein
VVIAVGSKVNENFSTSFPKEIKVYSIGDSKKSRKILEAIHEGTQIAHRI